MHPAAGESADGPPQLAPADPSRRVVVWTIRLTALVALCASGYLSWVSLSSGSGEMIGCGFSQAVDCEHVINSKWSTWLGVPVSLGGLVVYGTLFVVSMMVGPRASGRFRRMGPSALRLLAAVAAGAAVWFIYVQAVLLGSLCLWCMVVHLCGLALAACVLLGSPQRLRGQPSGGSVILVRESLGLPQSDQNASSRNVPLSRWPATAWPLITGFATTLILIAGQLVSSPGMVVELAETPSDNDLSSVAVDPDVQPASPADPADSPTDEVDGSPPSSTPSGPDESIVAGSLPVAEVPIHRSAAS